MRYHVDYVRISWRNFVGDEVVYVMTYEFK